jgi:hypothetical protein
VAAGYRISGRRAAQNAVSLCSNDVNGHFFAVNGKFLPFIVFFLAYVPAVPTPSKYPPFLHSYSLIPDIPQT